MAFKHILVTGACGQVGSELISYLSSRFGSNSIVASDVKKCVLPPGIAFADLDIMDRANMDSIIRENGIDTVFHLAAILSAVGEKNPGLAFSVNLQGTFNILESAHENGVERVMIPSTIGVFGPETPKDNVPTLTVIKPRTMYGITKYAIELLGNYYFEKFDLDVRGLRYPGLLSHKTAPTAGTTDYAVDVFYHAVTGKKYTCFLEGNTRLPMMYMPDAINSFMKLAEASRSKLRFSMDYNVSAYTFDPEGLFRLIRKYIPDLEVEYKPDFRQKIADSWPASLDSSDAVRDWGFSPEYDLERTVQDMIHNLKSRLEKDGHL
ncbi:MAG: NAD-dependent epimerase/dehydratase family protein [Thermoplasmataceae archaeon]